MFLEFFFAVSVIGIVTIALFVNPATAEPNAVRFEFAKLVTCGYGKTIELALSDLFSKLSPQVRLELLPLPVLRELELRAKLGKLPHARFFLQAIERYSNPIGIPGSRGLWIKIRHTPEGEYTNNQYSIELRQKRTFWKAFKFLELGTPLP